jgi:hypothetical protein
MKKPGWLRKPKSATKLQLKAAKKKASDMSRRIKHKKAQL